MSENEGQEGMKIPLRYRLLNEFVQRVVGRVPAVEKMAALDRAAHIIKESKALDFIGNSGRVLDVGTGPGHILEKISEKVSEEVRVFGFDPWAKPFDSVRKRMGDGSHFVRAVAQSIPFANDSFDVVTAFFVFHHIPKDEWSKIFDEIKRVAKPGAKLLLVEDTPRDEKESKLMKSWDRRSNVELQGKRSHMSVDEWKGFVEAMGCKVETVVNFSSHDSMTDKDIPHSNIVVSLP